MKVVINTCYGGFNLSDKAMEMLGIDYSWKIERTDPNLVKVVESLGEEANGHLSRLKVVEIPDDVEWFIDDYDGIETIHEKHRIWS